MIKLYCGDYCEVLGHVHVDLIFTSPPYNIGSKAARKDGFRKFGAYDPKSFRGVADYPDNLPEDIYQDQQASFLIWAAAHLKPGGILVYNHKPRRRNNAMIHPAKWFTRPAVEGRLTLMEEIVWDRGSTHNHDKHQLWPHTEMLYVFRRHGDRYLLDNRKYSNVWSISRAKLSGHNAPFPEALAARVIELWSQPGGLVCDPYSGSGTVAVVAERMGRRFEGAEILEKYYALASERIAAARAKAANQKASIQWQRECWPSQATESIISQPNMEDHR